VFVSSEVQGALGISIAATSTVIDILNTAPTGAHPCCVTEELQGAQARLAAEHEQLLGRHSALTEGASGCKGELADTKRAAEQTRVDLSTTQLQRDAAQAQLEQLRAELSAMRTI
jgi:hypothetical protein